MLDRMPDVQWRRDLKVSDYPAAAKAFGLRASGPSDWLAPLVARLRDEGIDDELAGGTMFSAEPNSKRVFGFDTQRLEVAAQWDDNFRRFADVGGDVGRHLRPATVDRLREVVNLEEQPVLGPEFVGRVFECCNGVQPSGPINPMTQSVESSNYLVADLDGTVTVFDPEVAVIDGWDAGPALSKWTHGVTATSTLEAAGAFHVRLSEGRPEQSIADLSGATDLESLERFERYVHSEGYLQAHSAVAAGLAVQSDRVVVLVAWVHASPAYATTHEARLRGQLANPPLANPPLAEPPPNGGPPEETKRWMADLLAVARGGVALLDTKVDGAVLTAVLRADDPTRLLSSLTSGMSPFA